MKNTHGFTVVELLIVIVVIAILGTISVVAYSGIRDRANNAVVAQSLSQVARKIKAHVAQYGGPPNSLEDIGIDNTTGDISLSYKVDQTTSPQGWCVAGDMGAKKWYQTDMTNEPKEGVCYLAAAMSSKGIADGVRTIIFVGVAHPTGSQYAFDFRPAVSVYAYKPHSSSGNLSVSSGVVWTNQDGKYAVHYVSSAPQQVYIGQRYSLGEAWAGEYRVEAYSTVLTTAEINSVIARLKASF